MPRTTVSEVRDIADFELTDSELNAFINDANAVVNDRLDPYVNDSTQLTLIEKYLSAHLASLKDQRESESQIGDDSRVYEGDTETTGWELTRYGQMAVRLDPTGRLKSGSTPSHVETVYSSGKSGRIENTEK